MLRDGKPFLNRLQIIPGRDTVRLIGISQPVMADMRGWTQLLAGTSENSYILRLSQDSDQSFTMGIDEIFCKHCKRSGRFEK